MKPTEFLCNLHFDIDKVRPVDVEVDWEDAPLPFKMYQGLSAVQLPFEVSFDFLRSPGERALPVNQRTLGNLLWYSYGLTQLSHALVPFDSVNGVEPHFMQLLRRYVPSGGGLYPSELYVYVKTSELPQGVYHYDVAHHRLVLLREGNFDEYLECAVGHRCNMSSCFGALFISTMFWKNFYKYNDFAYRLQAVDAGALIGQISEVTKRCGYQSRVYFQFLDRALNHLLGLSDDEETVYAMMPLSSTGEVGVASSRGATPVDSAHELCQELGKLSHRHYIKSRRVAKSPTLIEMNELSMMNSARDIVGMVDAQVANDDMEGDVIPLPDASKVDTKFTLTCRKRYSPGLDFVPQRTDVERLSTLLYETMSATRDSGTDVDFGVDSAGSRVAIAGCLYGVEGLPDGAYVYDSHHHALLQRRVGDQRTRLHQGMTMPTVNLFQVPLCLHLVGPRNYNQHGLGYRGYRILQMQVGMLLQRLLLCASALDFNGHPLLGYDERQCDSIYNFGNHGSTCLVQVPVGAYRKSSRFEGPLA